MTEILTEEQVKILIMEHPECFHRERNWDKIEALRESDNLIEELVAAIRLLSGDKPEEELKDLMEALKHKPTWTCDHWKSKEHNMDK